jgi:succinyl-CoA synthetase beta subunit
MQVVLKSQIYAGGRGLGSFTNGLKGGVHVCNTDEVKALAEKMLGQTLVTKQTGPAGVTGPLSHVVELTMRISVYHPTKLPCCGG